MFLAVVIVYVLHLWILIYLVFENHFILLHK